MAVFRYKMQGILDIKEKLEDRAKQEFAEANMRLDAEKKKLDELQARKFYYMQEGVKLRMELIDVRKIRENKMAVLKMDEYIADQMREIARAAKRLRKRGQPCRSSCRRGKRMRNSRRTHLRSL